MEQLIARVARGVARTPNDQVQDLRCALSVIGILGESEDVPPSGPAALMVDLRITATGSMREEQLPDELAANSLAYRCLESIPRDRLELPEMIRRERHYLIDGLGRDELSETDVDDFNQLDEVRSVLRALKRLRPDISDKGLAARVDEWVAVESTLRGH